MNRLTSRIVPAACALLLAQLAAGSAKGDAQQESPTVPTAPKSIPPGPVLHDAARRGIDMAFFASHQHGPVAKTPGMPDERTYLELGNDHCADGIPITDGNWAYDTTGATTDGNAHAECQFDGQTYHDIWYNYEAPCSGDLTVSTCNRAYYDTDLVVYDGCVPDIHCPPGDAELLGCNDDYIGCDNFSSLIENLPVIEGHCYTIRAGGWNDGDQGTGTLTIFTCPTAENDDCADRIEIFDGDTPFSTLGMTTDGNIHANCQFDGQTYHDIWYNYTATCHGELTVTTCEDIGGSASYDTDLVVYDGCLPDLPCPPTDADLLGCNDDNCSLGSHSFLQVLVAEGNCYEVRVGGWQDGDQGTGTLSIACETIEICGDGYCDPGENCCNCELDCGPCVCGDGTCDAPCEDFDNCTEDCGETPECTIFNNQAEFEAFNLLHGNGLKGVEDFEEGTLPPSSVDLMDDPLCGGVPDAPEAFPYPNGLDQLNICLQSNLSGGSASVPNPRGANGLAATSAGFQGAASDSVFANTFVDSLDLMFGDPVPPDQQDNPTGVGFDTVTLVGGTMVEIVVYDKNNALIATATASADEVGSNFWGIWCSGTIGRISIFDPTGGAEGSDNIQLWVELPCDPECPQGSQCIHGACCGDGVVRGHEECDYSCCDCGTCPWDVDGSGNVGASDLAFLLGNWGPIPPDADPIVVCMDAEADGMIGAFDLANLLGNWGDCPVGGGDNQCVEGQCTALCECVGRGACCGVEGNPTDCDQNRTAAECADVNGSYTGDDTTCEDCPDPACFNAEGSCFEPHLGPGCAHLACCGIVCDINPLCCEEWDSICVGEAEALCTPPFCGDGPCDPGEVCCNCEEDCGPCVCGDGICDAPCESNTTCPADCSPVIECAVDDGSSENSLGYGAGGELAWIQVCDGAGDAVTVESIQTTFGSPLFPGGSGVSPGDTFRVYVWSNPNLDGSLLDAVLVCETSAIAEAGSIETDVFQTIPLDPACGAVSFGAGERFFIGASAVHGPGKFPAPMDETEPLAHQSWYHLNGPPFDPTDMDGATFMDDVGFDADWLLRASFTP